MSDAANRRKVLRLTAQMGTLVAAFGRFREGKEPVVPNSKLDHTANLLYMLTGNVPDGESAGWFDVALILHANHSYNASAFAAWVAAWPLSDMHSAIVSGIGTTKGPAARRRQRAGHEDAALNPDAGQGRAVRPQPPGKEEKGDGFRVSRPSHGRPASHGVTQNVHGTGSARRANRGFEISKQIKELIARERKINPNVDLYSASACYVLRIPIDLYPLIFAVHCMPGWTAHRLEQCANNKLTRPLAEYAGPIELKWLPTEQR